MIQASIDELLPGMVVARSVLFGTGGGVQLAAGFVLDESIISRCRKMGMRSLWIHLEGEDVLPACNVNDQLALQAQQTWKENMDMLRKIGDVQESTLENLSKFTADPGRFKDIVATDRIKGLVDQIIRAILEQEPLVINLASMRTQDGYLYQHALDVTITSIMLAQKLKFIPADIQELALGCFLMDLGMIIVPQTLYEKKDAWSAQEMHLLREHPAVGFAILRANDGIPINAAHVAYQHHEWLDGSGYPRKLKGEDVFLQKTLNGVNGVHRYAQVAAVADMYISSISPRPGAEPLSPLQAMQLLISQAGGRLNSHVVNALLSMVPVFPVGTRILVTKSPKSNLLGHQGVVSRANPKEKEKPQVILLFDKFKRRVPLVLVDLAEEQGYEIQFAAL